MTIAPMPGSVRREKCPNRDQHVDSPNGYMAWHAWAEEKAKTHDQHRCPGCSLYMLWTPKASASERQRS